MPIFTISFAAYFNTILLDFWHLKSALIITQIYKFLLCFGIAFFKFGVMYTDWVGKYLIYEYHSKVREYYPSRNIINSQINLLEK